MRLDYCKIYELVEFFCVHLGFRSVGVTVSCFTLCNNRDWKFIFSIK